MLTTVFIGFVYWSVWKSKKNCDWPFITVKKKSSLKIDFTRRPLVRFLFYLINLFEIVLLKWFSLALEKGVGTPFMGFFIVWKQHSSIITCGCIILSWTYEMKNSSRLKKHLYNCIPLVFLVMDYCRLYSARNNVFENLCTLQNNFQELQLLSESSFQGISSWTFWLLLFSVLGAKWTPTSTRGLQSFLFPFYSVWVSSENSNWLTKHSLQLCSFGTNCKKTTFSFLLEFILITFWNFH